MSSTSLPHPVPHVVRRGVGVPVLFVHGNGVDHRLLLELDDVFADEGEWERIYVDLPGFGRTAALPGRGGMPDLADWLDVWVTETVGETPFALVATSMGGLLASDLVARRRGQCLGLALLAPVVQPAHDLRALPAADVTEDSALLATLEPGDAHEYAAMAVDQSRPGWERFRRAALPGIRVADEAAVERLGAMYELPEPDLGRFAAPTLVITGRQDTVVGFEDQWSWPQGLRRASFAVLDRAGHNVHLDQPEAVSALLGTWAASLDTGPDAAAARSIE